MRADHNQQQGEHPRRRGDVRPHGQHRRQVRPRHQRGKAVLCAGHHWRTAPQLLLGQWRERAAGQQYGGDPRLLLRAYGCAVRRQAHIPRLLRHDGEELKQRGRGDTPLHDPPLHQRGQQRGIRARQGKCRLRGIHTSIRSGSGAEGRSPGRLLHNARQFKRHGTVLAVAADGWFHSAGTASCHVARPGFPAAAREQHYLRHSDNGRRRRQRAYQGWCPRTEGWRYVQRGCLAVYQRLQRQALGRHALCPEDGGQHHNRDL